MPKGIDTNASIDAAAIAAGGLLRASRPLDAALIGDELLLLICP